MRVSPSKQRLVYPLFLHMKRSWLLGWMKKIIFQKLIDYAQRALATQIVHYDSLLDKIVSRYAVSRRDIEPRNGWCFVFHLLISSHQENKKAYIADYGAGETSRLSVVLEQDVILFECAGPDGQLDRLSANVKFDVPTHVRFEFATDHDGIYMSLNVNNIEQDLRVGNRLFDFSPDVNAFTLGASSYGKSGAAFTIHTHYIAKVTLSVLEKLASFHYFQRRLSAFVGNIEFRPESFMVMSPNGTLVQEHAQLKPIYRTGQS